MASPTLVITGTRLCGFCRDGNHSRCPHAIQNGQTNTTPARPRIWLCPCAEPGCGGKIFSCIHCKRVHDDVDPTERVCMDRDACLARLEVGRQNSPVYMQVREIQEKHRMAKEANTTTREPAKPKVGVCKCGCDGATKGGNFLPGHDARLVSQKVAAVLDRKQTEASARKDMSGFSDALKAKFDKSLGLAQAKVAKAAEAEKAKKEAKAAKEAEAKAAKEAKAAEKAASKDDAASAATA
jgi:hypothetical protein